MVLLDERFFPHILDAVFDNLDFSGYIVAAQVSKAWREKASKVLQRHVEVEPTPSGLLLTPKIIKRPEVSLPRYFLSHSLIDSLVVKGPRWHAASLYRQLLDNIDILDVDDGHLYNDQTSRLTLYARESAHSLALMMTMLRLSTVRRILTQTLGHPCDHIFQNVDTQVYFDITSRPYPKIDVGHVMRLVLNIDYFPTSTPWDLHDRFGMDRWITSPSQCQGKELVVVMHNLGNRVDIDEKTLARRARFVARYFHYFWVWFPVTLVGIDVFFPTQSVYEVFRDRLIEWAADAATARWYQPRASSDDMKDMYLRFSVLTHKEYRERVGREVYQLHAVP